MAARAATDDELLALIPQLTCVDETIRLAVLDMAAGMISVECFGEKYSTAQIYLTGHMLALTQAGVAANGPVVSKTIGSISATYAISTPPSDPLLSSTSYGQLYLMLRDSVPCLPMVVGP